MKLILCCDYGLDDAAATADALKFARDDGYCEAVLVAIGGNVPPDVALANCKKLVAHLSYELPLITIVDTTAKRQPYEFLKKIHGNDGMGNMFEDVADGKSVAFDEWLNTLSGEYDLLSLGPMTLVEEILKRGNCRKLVFMAGNIAQEPNFHGYEFNHALDREAFSRIVTYEHVAVTMDTCRVPLLNVQDSLPEEGSLVSRFVHRAREMTFVSGEKGCYLWDDIAVKVLRHPSWFVTEKRVDRDGNHVNVARYVLSKPYSEIMDI